MIKEYSVELRELRQQLEAMRYKIGVYLPTETYNKLQEELTEFKEKEIILTEKIEMKEKELSEVQELFERQTRELTQTTKKYEETKVRQSTSNEFLMDLTCFFRLLWSRPLKSSRLLKMNWVLLKKTLSNTSTLFPSTSVWKLNSTRKLTYCWALSPAPLATLVVCSPKLVSAIFIYFNG